MLHKYITTSADIDQKTVRKAIDARIEILLYSSNQRLHKMY